MVPERLTGAPKAAVCEPLRPPNSDCRACTVTVAIESSVCFCTEPLFEVTVEAFKYCPAGAFVAVTPTLTTCVAARFPKLQDSTWLPAMPFSRQVPGPVYAGLNIQVTGVPGPGGNGSLRVTLVIGFAGAVMVFVKPIVAGASIVPTLAASKKVGLSATGNATTTSLNCRVVPPIPESTF